MFDWREVSQRRGIAATLTVLAGLSILAPLRPAASPETSVGLFLIAGAILEWVHGQRRPTAAERLSAWREGAVTLLMATLLLGAPLLSGNALVIFLAVSFIVEGVRHLARGLRRRSPASPGASPRGALDIAAGVALLLFLRGNAAVVWTVAVGRRLPPVRCRRAHHPRPRAPKRRSRRFADRGPAAARRPGAEGPWRRARTRGRGAGAGRPRMGDGVPGHAARDPRRSDGRRAVPQQPARPGRRGARRRPRRLARHDGRRAAVPPDGAAGQPARSSGAPGGGWSPARRRRARQHAVRRGAHGADVAPALRDAVARSHASRLPAAVGRGVRIGLPFAAIIAATVPMWGMSWYFDTENWAAGIWNSWAETRTDDLARGHGARRRRRRNAEAGRAAAFSVSPPGWGGDVLVPRHRRHRRRRRFATRRCATSCCRRRARGRAVRRGVVRRRLSDRRDEGLRAQVLAAVQGRDQAGLRDPRQPRLVRRARGFNATFLDAERRAGRHARARRRGHS